MTSVLILFMDSSQDMEPKVKNDNGTINVNTFIAEEKVVYMMENIAPAVLNGGFSTLLALSTLVTSTSHVVSSFFRIFFMICVFGLFHGLILLPTVLCMIGPSDEDMIRKNNEHKPTENGHTSNGVSKSNNSKYELENDQNLQTESETQVPLTLPEMDISDVINENFIQTRETNLC